MAARFVNIPLLKPYVLIEPGFTGLALGAALLFLLGQGLAAGLTRHATDNAAHTAGLAAGAVLGAMMPFSPRLGGRPSGAVMRACRRG